MLVGRPLPVGYQPEEYHYHQLTRSVESQDMCGESWDAHDRNLSLEQSVNTYFAFFSTNRDLIAISGYQKSSLTVFMADKRMSIGGQMVRAS